MSDTYIQFSKCMSVSKRDVKWIKAEIAFFRNPPPIKSAAAFDKFAARCDEYEILENDCLDFQIEYTPGEVIFFSEDYGNPFHVARLVQRLFSKYHKKKYFTISYAVTCSRMAPGAFEGGAMFVTAEGVECINLDDILRSKTEAFISRMKRHEPHKGSS